MSDNIYYKSVNNVTYPALLSIIEDRTVRAELAHLGCSVDTLLDPLDPVLVRLVHEVQRAEVCAFKKKKSTSPSPSPSPKTRRKRTRVEILREQVVIMVANSVEQRLIHVIVPKSSGSDLVDDAGQPGRLLFERDGVVHVLVPEVLDGRCQVSEEDFKKGEKSICQRLILRGRV